MSFFPIGRNDQRLKEGKKTPRKGFLTRPPGSDLLRTATSFSEFCELIKVIRRKRKPPIRVPQKQLVFHRRTQPIFFASQNTLSRKTTNKNQNIKALVL
jgi:hypothetical protein